MMPALADFALAIGSSFALSLIVKATATLAATFISVRLARTHRAAVRHLLLAAGFGVLLMLPMASAAMPTHAVVGLPAVAATLPIPISLAAPVPAEFRPAAKAAGARSTPAVSKEPLPMRSDRQPMSELLTIAWAMGALVCLVPVLVGLFQVRALRRSGRPWPHGMSVLQHVAKDAGTHRLADVLLHDAISGPASCGLMRPAIVLPADAQTWRDDELARALVHEWEHVRRADWASQCLARVVCACYWFHPLVWIAWRRLVLEAERACDDAVLRDAEPTVYADQLVALAERLSTAPKPPLLAMANRTDLAARIAAVLDSRQPRGRAGRLAVVLVCVVAALLTATMSPLRVIASAVDSAQQVRRIHGQRFSGQFGLDPLRHMEVETVMLTFPATELGREFTVDFTTRYLRDRPVPGPGSVDLVITQHPANDASPEVTISSDGRTLPLATQRQARRSVAATISVAEVQRIVDAGGITDQTFNVELRFSPEQVHGLRLTVDEWVKRLQP
jgi:beta-lactamase regulating signal transducer with metallopeptidase domain